MLYAGGKLTNVVNGKTFQLVGIVLTEADIKRLRGGDFVFRDLSTEPQYALPGVVVMVGYGSGDIMRAAESMQAAIANYVGEGQPENLHG